MTKMKKFTPVKTDSRICFAIEYFTTDADARAYGEQVKRRGDRYNGGYFDGMPCGRDVSFDYLDADLGQLYAVTVR